MNVLFFFSFFLRNVADNVNQVFYYPRQKFIRNLLKNTIIFKMYKREKRGNIKSDTKQIIKNNLNFRTS